MKPNEFIARLQSIAQDSRHHPEPAVAVSLLAQLLLDLSIELQAAADKFKPFLKSVGLPSELDDIVSYVESELARFPGEPVELSAADAAAIAQVLQPLKSVDAAGSPAEPAPEIFPAEPVQLPVGYTVESATINGQPATVTEIPAEVLPETPAA